MRYRVPLIVVALLMTTLALFVVNLLFGTLPIPAKEVCAILLRNTSDTNPVLYSIVWHSRFPAAVTALCCGACLSAAGLLLQTALRNPMAGPSMLGIDSGAQLGVAVCMMLLGNFAVSVFAALIGAMCVLALLLSLNRVFRSPVMLLIAGLMINYIVGSLISLLNYSATKESLQSFVLWGMGSFRGVTLARLPYFVGLSLVGLASCVMLIKPLNALLLGEKYAQNLGVHMRRTRRTLLLTTGLLSAACTAFCGPVAFIGLAVPHVTRLLLRDVNHRTLVPATLLCGSTLTLTCHFLSALPGQSLVLPINVLTPLIGAPVVLYVLLTNKNL